MLILFNLLSCFFFFHFYGKAFNLKPFFCNAKLDYAFFKMRNSIIQKALLSQLHCISPQLLPRSPEPVDVYSGTQGLVLTASTTWQLLLFSQNYGDKARQREPVVVSISKVKWHSRNLQVNRNRKETKPSCLGSLTWTHLEKSEVVIGGKKKHRLALNKGKGHEYLLRAPNDTMVMMDLMTWNMPADLGKYFENRKWCTTWTLRYRRYPIELR